MAPGAVIGAYLTEVVPGRILGVVFGLFLIVIAMQMILSITPYQHRIAEKQNKSRVRKNASETKNGSAWHLP